MAELKYLEQFKADIEKIKEKYHIYKKGEFEK